MNHLEFFPFPDCIIDVTDKYGYKHRYELSSINHLSGPFYQRDWLIYISKKNAPAMEYEYIAVDSEEEGERIINSINRKKQELGIE